jgi:hypothetical protein
MFYGGDFADDWISNPIISKIASIEHELASSTSG